MPRMTIDTLHPDIARSEAEAGRQTVRVIDPSPGLWGGDPIEGLVGIEYQCPDAGVMSESWPGHYKCTGDPKGHTHGALYGPKDEQDVASGYSLYAD